MTDQTETPEADVFDAELEAARLEQDVEIEAEQPEPEQAEPAPDPERQRLEKIAQDKEGMARSERQKRRDAENERDRFRAELEALKAQKPQPDPFAEVAGIDVEQDPVGAVLALQKAAAAMQQQQQVQQGQTAQQQQFQRLNQAMQAYEADFRADNPDYDAAVAFLRQSRADELADQGYGGQELQSALAHEFIGIATRTLQSSKDPAEVVYNLAKKRGYTADKGTDQPQNTGKVVDIASQQLQAVQRGQSASRSLGSVAAKPNSGGLTMAAVAALDGAAFDAAFERLAEQERRKA